MSLEVSGKNPPELVHHDSEEFESAEEIDGDGYEVEEIEIEEEVEEEEEEEDDFDEKENDDDKEPECDEDRRNPQYIPRKGYFYEHDDRTTAEDAEPEETEESEPEKTDPEKPLKPSKPVKAVSDRWTHDKYNEEEQAPKTSEELAQTYGYDIRNEDSAPRARRRRRYGRGPNKYTRNWEDEDQYQKPRGRGGYRGRPRGGSRGGGGPRRPRPQQYEEDFPSLQDSQQTRSSTYEGRGRGSQRRDRGGSSRPSEDSKPSHNEQEEYYEREQNKPPRGGSGNRGGDRGWRRRNEFSNRNRYPTSSGGSKSGGGGENYKRENIGTTSSSHGKENINKSSAKPEKQHSYYQQNSNSKHESEGRKNMGHHHSSNTGGADSSMSRHHPSSGHSGGGKSGGPPKTMPPFTPNTEYTGSASLTAKRQGAHHEPENVNEPHHSLHRSPELLNIHEQNLDMRIDTSMDLRESLNRRANNRAAAPPTKKNVPPSYSQPNVKSEPKSHPDPLQQQQHQPEMVRPKRFSAQRQRQPVDMPAQTTVPIMASTMGVPIQVAASTLSTASGGGGPPMPSVVTSTIPPSTGSMVASPVPPYVSHQPQPYYEQGAQGTGNGASVSPSMWTSHGAPPFAAPPVGPQAPYPSPPGQGQVTVSAQPPYSDPTNTTFIAAPQAGHPLYAAPHQYIHPQDPNLLNYGAGAPAPAFAPPAPNPYHTHGAPGYATGFPPVAPVPPHHELYHSGGVTYYNTQNQLQRPPVVPPQSQKRPKASLQLIEPPEKSKQQQQRDALQPVEQAMDEYLATAEDIPLEASNEVEPPKQSPSYTSGTVEPSSEQLPEALSNLSLSGEKSDEKTEMWSQMEDSSPLQSPTEKSPPECAQLTSSSKTNNNAEEFVSSTTDSSPVVVVPQENKNELRGENNPVEEKVESSTTVSSQVVSSVDDSSSSSKNTTTNVISSTNTSNNDSNTTESNSSGSTTEVLSSSESNKTDAAAVTDDKEKK